MRIIKHFFPIMWSRFLINFNIWKNEKVIPKGHYCYEPDYEKNSSKENIDMSYYIIPCKYYKWFGKNYKGCEYLGIIIDDICLNDQCKVCDINID